MDRFEGTHIALTLALHGGLYIAILMDLYEGPHSALTIALHGGLYLGIIMDRLEGLTLPLQ
jgi:hypothetical protein